MVDWWTALIVMTCERGVQHAVGDGNENGKERSVGGQMRYVNLALMVLVLHNFRTMSKRLSPTKRHLYCSTGPLCYRYHWARLRLSSLNVMKHSNIYKRVTEAHLNRLYYGHRTDYLAMRRLWSKESPHCGRSSLSSFICTWWSNKSIGVLRDVCRSSARVHRNIVDIVTWHETVTMRRGSGVVQKKLVMRYNHSLHFTFAAKLLPTNHHSIA